MIMNTGEWLREVLEGAPTDVRINPELRGWMLKEEKEYVCARCAARAMARGCWRWNGTKASPVWMEQPKPAECCCCEVEEVEEELDEFE
jgi:hypothetical protein